MEHSCPKNGIKIENYRPKNGKFLTYKMCELKNWCKNDISDLSFGRQKYPQSIHTGQ